MRSLGMHQQTSALEEAVLMRLPSMGVRRTALLTFWDSGKRVDRILMMAWPEEDFAARCATTKHTVSASLCKRKHCSPLYTPQAQCCGLPECSLRAAMSHSSLRYLLKLPCKPGSERSYHQVCAQDRRVACGDHKP